MKIGSLWIKSICSKFILTGSKIISIYIERTELFSALHVLNHHPLCLTLIPLELSKHQEKGD